MPEATHCRNPAALSLSLSLSLRDLIAFTSHTRGRTPAQSLQLDGQHCTIPYIAIM
jgi:hypothetical protein